MAPSSTIAEFCALDVATKEAIWLRKLTTALKLNKECTVPNYTDSANVLIFAEKKGYNPLHGG